MKLFLVSPQDEYAEQVQKLIDKHFPNHHIPLDNRKSDSWIIAAPTNITPASVADSLNMAGKAGDGINAGLVVQIHDYFGYDSGALWQQINVWANDE